MTKEEEEVFEKKALDQLLTGKNLFGKDGAFAPMLKGFIEKALEVEMEAHLSESENNKRNGKGKKTLKSSLSASKTTLVLNFELNFLRVISVNLSFFL